MFLIFFWFIPNIYITSFFFNVFLCQNIYDEKKERVLVGEYTRVMKCSKSFGHEFSSNCSEHPLILPVCQKDNVLRSLSLLPHLLLDRSSLSFNGTATRQ